MVLNPGEILLASRQGIARRLRFQSKSLIDYPLLALMTLCALTTRGAVAMDDHIESQTRLSVKLVGLSWYVLRLYVGLQF